MKNYNYKFIFTAWIFIIFIISGCESYASALNDANYQKSIKTLGLNDGDIHTIRATYYPNKSVGYLNLSSGNYGKLFIAKDKIVFAIYDEKEIQYQKYFEASYSDIESISRAGFFDSKIMRVHLKNNYTHSFRFDIFDKEAGEALGRSELIECVIGHVESSKQELIVPEKPEYMACDLHSERISENYEEDPWLVLKGKFAYFDSDQVDNAILSNNKKPTASEKNAINKWLQKRDGYFEDMKAQNKENPQNSSIQEIRQTLNINQYVKRLAVDLCAGKISYGQFAKKKAAYESAYEARIATNKLRQERKEELAHQNEMVKEERESRRRERQVQYNNGYSVSNAQLSRNAQIANEQLIRDEQNRQSQAIAAQAQMEEQMKQAKRDAAIQALNNYVQQEEMQRQQQNMQRQQALQQAQQQMYQYQMLDVQRRMLQQQQLQNFR